MTVELDEERGAQVQGIITPDGFLLQGRLCSFGFLYPWLIDSGSARKGASMLPAVL